MKEIFNKMMIVLSITFLLTAPSCFAYVEESSVINENKLVKTYTVEKEGQQEFLNKIQKEYSDEEYSYKLEKQDKSGGDYTESKDIVTTKTISLKTNNTQQVYELDFNSVELKTDEYITSYQFRFGTVEIGFKEVESPILYCNMLDNLPNGFIFTNKTKVSGTYFEAYIENNDDWTTIIYKKEITLNKVLPRTRILKIKDIDRK